jgi:succinate-semialdehyde dehydrogenase/glutarate-semialdehyde dehydrogenase
MPPSQTAASLTPHLIRPDTVARLASLVTAAAGRPTQTSYSPLDGSPLGAVPVCDADDVARAVAAARATQHDWAARPLRDRSRIMLRFHDLVLAAQPRLLDLVQLETGKARLSAFEELADVAGTARYYAHSAAHHLRPRRRQGALPFLTATVEQHHPKGVVGIISPWNYPLTLAVSDAVPALLAGNGVVLKPDSQTVFTALAAVELLIAAGVPAELVQVVTGPGPDLGPPLVAAVDYMMFTGSTRTGRLIAEQCSQRLIGFSAELGGKNPMIVLADADIGAAVEGAVRGCFGSSGQLCISIERLYVQDAVHDEFVAAFVERVQRMHLAAGVGWTGDMGPLTSPDQLATVTRHVQDAVDKGARVLAGGRARPDLAPWFYEPTVLDGVTPEMELFGEETFGPVVAVYRVSDDDEAVAAANASEYGLNASVWAARRHAQEVAARVRCGTVVVNDAYAPAWGSTDAPMGGVKSSGVGRRHGREGIVKYTEPQTVATQQLLPIAPPPGVTPERFAAVLSGALKVLRHVPFFS